MLTTDSKVPLRYYSNTETTITDQESIIKAKHILHIKTSRTAYLNPATSTRTGGTAMLLSTYPATLIKELRHHPQKQIRRIMELIGRINDSHALFSQCTRLFTTMIVLNFQRAYQEKRPYPKSQKRYGLCLRSNIGQQNIHIEDR